MASLSSAHIESYELSSSPAGRLVSFQADDALAAALGANISASASCWMEKGSLVARVGSELLAFAGAEAFVSEWNALAPATYLCAFHSSFSDGAMAFELSWSAPSVA